MWYQLVSGRSKLSGHVSISGAKNSALAVLAGSLCSCDDVCIRNVPSLLDVSRMLQVLKSLGAHVRHCGNDIYINSRNVSFPEPCEESIQKIRAGFFVIGPLVARHGEAILALPGGCAIGSRPVDLHLRGLEALGAEVEVRQGKVHAWVGNGGRKLKGGCFCMDFPSVGATETLMMAACLAEGKSVLTNVAREPEVKDLANFLIACGAKIEGAGTSTLVIEGVDKLHGANYTIIPDRIEAGTFLIAAAITRSSLTLSPIISSHLTAVMMKLASVGCKFNQLNANTVQIRSSPAFPALINLEMATGPYPSFPTDLQPQIMSLLATCTGQSVIKETMFEERMGHVEELKKLGAQINISRNTAVIQGTSDLSGTRVKANDLRAGSALILAGMAAEGVSIIEGASHVDRGYERFDEKLRMLGANIERL
ncbi:hypothetical protein GOP47_0018852 [Adiantum capillus-veneris]|uniref:UDP-N-acetylglucosamine 1-carboxyvinyltransferase n=1 Tax=Adiantum capillus-veneris TaxID=13818 RepID=A0A9D4UEX7_ADICA|nr:hypothetical protein GOP47_0018852 [Adiantum capillus-veneris]